MKYTCWSEQKKEIFFNVVYVKIIGLGRIYLMTLSINTAIILFL